MPFQREDRKAETVAVPLAELALALRLQQQRQMGKTRHAVFPAESTIKQDVQRRTGQPLLTTDDMGYFHQVVVDNVGKMIGRQLVRTLVKHLVVQDVTFDADIAPNHVVDMDFLSRIDLEADNKLLSVVNQTVHFFLRHRQRVAHLHTCVGVILEVLYLLASGFQLFRCVESNVSLAGIQQLTDVFLVNLTTLTLTVRAVFPTEADTFVELDSQPFERVKDILLCTGNEAVGIRIFNTENQFAAMLTGEKVVVQSRTHTADMQGTRRTRCKAHPHISFCHCLDESLKYYFPCKINVFF